MPGHHKGVDREVSTTVNRAKNTPNKPQSGAKLICASWLANGGCRFIDDGCMGAHPPAMANLARGQGGGKGGKGKEWGGKGTKRGRDSEKKKDE